LRKPATLPGYGIKSSEEQIQFNIQQNQKKLIQTSFIRLFVLNLSIWNEIMTTIFQIQITCPVRMQLESFPTPWAESRETPWTRGQSITGLPHTHSHFGQFRVSSSPILFTIFGR